MAEPPATGRRGVPFAEVAHVMPGRTRLRLPALRGDPVALAAVAAQLARLPGVTATEVRTFTASILVHHEHDFEDLARRAAADRVFALAEGDEARVAAITPVAGALPAAIAVAFVGLGVMQALDRRVLPPALTLFWYAASLGREAMAARGEGPDDE